MSLQMVKIVLLLCASLLLGRAAHLDSVKYTSIGCFNDLFWYPATPSLEGQDPRLDGDNYRLRENAIHKCALVAKERGYKVFAVQDGGKCLSSSNAQNTFSRYGVSGQCKSNGKGGDRASHAYVLGSLKDLYSTIEYESLGCYKYNSEMTVLEGTDPDVLDGNYKLRTDAIDKCALATTKTRYMEAFAVRDGGACLASGILNPTFNKYGISQDCKSDGKGGAEAIHVYVIGGTKGVIRQTEHGYPRGCYKDLPVRAMASLEGQDHILDGNYTSRKNAIRKCVLVGVGRGYDVVGIQNGGMCVGSARLRDFNKYGISHDCKSDEKGGPWANEVHDLTYKKDVFYSADFFNSVKYESLGCYKDERARAIASMEGNDILLTDSYSLRKDAIQKCAVAAKLRGYSTFALQDGGMCVGSPIAHKTYDNYGKSQGCRNDGKGGIRANQVYNLTGTLEEILSSVFYSTLGCFKDEQARAIPSLEGQDIVLDGNYTTRQDGIRKCALAAKRRSHKVFVVMTDGQCVSGPNTARNFLKFGYIKTVCSTMAVNNVVYNFGRESYQDLLPLVKFESVGCYKDSKKRAIEKVDGTYLDDFPFPYMLDNYSGYKTRNQAIRKCALFAQLQGYEMFAIQDGGMCLTSHNAAKRYNKYGESQDCKSDGKGGPWANQVYRLPERKD